MKQDHGYRKITQIGTKINEIYMYDETKAIVHSGTSLYLWENFNDSTRTINIKEIYTDMNDTHSYFNKVKEKLFINDGKNYLVYNGTDVKKVVDDEPFVPTTTIGRKAGTIGGGEQLQDVNVLTPKRNNSFLADGKSSKFYLDAQNIDIDLVTAVVNGVKMVEPTGLSVDREKGIVTFSEIPKAPNLAGSDNVFITFSKTADGYSERISECSQALLFDNRIFFTGNPKYKNALFHSELNNPEYISDLSYYEDGSSDSAIKGMTVGNNLLWIFKDGDQNNANVFTHSEVLDPKEGKLYPAHQGNVSVGCYVGALNFQDDIIYLSRSGLEGISTINLDSKQIISHRSTLVDNKLTNDSNYEFSRGAIWKGYLCILTGGKMYLADSRQKFPQMNSFEYEWFYWDISRINPTMLKEYKGDLFIGTKDGSIYKFEGTNDDGEILNSYWTTPLDNFGFENQLKTTNKRGGIVKTKLIPNSKIKIARKTNKIYEYKYSTEASMTGFGFNNINFNNFSFSTGSQSYLVFKIKEKKINEISLKFYSDELDKPFGIYSAVMEAFVGGYVKK